MIATPTLQRAACLLRRITSRRWLPIALALAALLTACTNSKVIIGPLYNRLDDRLRDSVLDMADFTDEQVAAFDQRVGTFHVWHRQEELPRYAALLDEIAARAAVPEQLTRDDVERWFDTAERYTERYGDCHPVHYAIPIARTLSDAQLDAIAASLQKERDEHQERYASRSREERVSHRVAEARKWGSRIGVELTAAQLAELTRVFESQISLRQQYFAITERWRDTLFEILHAREDPDFEPRLAAHLAAYHTLLDQAAPEEMAFNRRLWRDYALSLLQTLSAEQRRTGVDWLTGMADTLRVISRAEPSFTIGDDPAIGCLPGTAAAVSGNG